MKHQSLIEHLNLPPGYNMEIAEKAIDRYFETAKKWHYSDGWDDGYSFGRSAAKYKLAEAAFIGAIFSVVIMVILGLIL